MTVSCAFCNGMGVQPHSLKMSCLACHGKGKVTFEHTVVTCSVCKGSGRASRLSMLSCIECRGVGMVEEVHGEKVYERKEHEKKRKLDIMCDVFRKIGKGLSVAGKWIKNRSIGEVRWFKTIVSKIQRH